MAITPVGYAYKTTEYDAELQKAFKRRCTVVDKIGVDSLDAFELWAFKANTPMIYDRRVIFIWNCAHSGAKIADEFDVEAALNKIITFWKDRFVNTEGFLWGD